MLEAKNLTKPYGGSTALDGLNLNIARGEIFCLLGANGGGKTTTINLFLNFIPPTSGTATINGMDVVAHPLETKRFIAYIPEQVMLYRNLTGLENLEYFTALAGMEKYTRPQLMNFLNDAGLPHGARESEFPPIRRGCGKRPVSRSRRRPRHLFWRTYNLISAEKEHGTFHSSHGHRRLAQRHDAA